MLPAKLKTSFWLSHERASSGASTNELLAELRLVFQRSYSSVERGKRWTHSGVSTWRGWSKASWEGA